MSAGMENHAVVSRETWLEARKALLDEEKALTRQRDELSRKRRELPWVRVEKTMYLTGRMAKRRWPICLADAVS
jgi:predicted dithiol-disulfide oxidoreductase (DUF899 family)